MHLVCPDYGAYSSVFNRLPATISYLNFSPIQIVSRCRDPQLQVIENYSNFFIIWNKKRRHILVPKQ